VVIIERFLKKVFGRERPSVPSAPAMVPDHHRVYAIGDIHGRADLLERIHSVILDDIADAAPETKLILIYLGDYVDRGMHSKEVIDLLVNHPLEPFEIVHLMGNHDEKMLNFVETKNPNPTWMSVGGDTTVYSYGVRVPKDILTSIRFDHIQNQLREKLPMSHFKFLRNLVPSYLIGDYFFTHAGINPDRAIDDQLNGDLIWGKKSFLSSNLNFGKTIVHGHTVGYEPVTRSNRICIDTGAFQSEVLTCLVLEKDSRRFLSTKP
jgi:serine/threonine protein phosphatase 1